MLRSYLQPSSLFCLLSPLCTFLHKKSNILDMNGLRQYQVLLRQCVSTLFVLVWQKCHVLPGVLPLKRTEREQIIAFGNPHTLQTGTAQ